MSNPIDLPAGSPPIEIDLNACGLRCPLPLLKAKQALNQVASGSYIRVLATDSGSVRDFHAFAELSGNQLYSFRDIDGIYEYILLKK
ncbi:sulfurtransferase TusA family protein [Saccharophagus sp. K07]|uniref:sulfurtransferase TusA family protein n=1 Tax=Saccharophagus sp. K07 TaxID=2283636 RepID=UPI00351C06B1